RHGPEAYPLVRSGPRTFLQVWGLPTSGNQPPACADSGKSADEGALDDEIGRMAERAFVEVEALDQFLHVLQHMHRAADHHAVGLRRQRRDAEIAIEAAVLDQPRDAAHARRDLARGGRIERDAALR